MWISHLIDLNKNNRSCKGNISNTFNRLPEMLIIFDYGITYFYKFSSATLKYLLCNNMGSNIGFHFSFMFSYCVWNNNITVILEYMFNLVIFLY